MVPQHSSPKMLLSTMSLMILCIMLSCTSAQYAPLMEDNVAIRTDIKGLSYANPLYWMDSYSDGDSCYCSTTFDHDIDVIQVNTPLGNMSIFAVCKLLGEGPRGSAGRPRYNDIQCGNGPANNAGDEVECPGRVEYGAAGCVHIGPKWNFSKFIKVSTVAPVNAGTRGPTKIPTRNPTIAPVSTNKPTNTPVATKKPTNAPVATKKPTNAPVATRKPTTVPTLRTKAPSNTPPTTSSTCKITQLDLWNGETDTLSIPKMFDGMNICSSLEMNVDAAAGPCVKYVKFTFTGPSTYIHKKDEYNAPFFLYGNSGRLVHGSRLAVGQYTLTATPNDVATASTTITFNVIKC